MVSDQVQSVIKVINLHFLSMCTSDGNFKCTAYVDLEIQKCSHHTLPPFHSMHSALGKCLEYFP